MDETTHVNTWKMWDMYCKQRSESRHQTDDFMQSMEILIAVLQHY